MLYYEIPRSHQCRNGRMAGCKLRARCTGCRRARSMSLLRSPALRRILPASRVARRSHTAALATPSELADSRAQPQAHSSLTSGASASTDANHSEWQRTRGSETAHDQSSNVPATTQSPLIAFPMPPFHTHEFYVALRAVFPDPVARCLMKATRALLVHRADKIDSEMLNRKDMDNVRSVCLCSRRSSAMQQAYLFRAALSELRTERTMRTRNEFATLQTTTGQLRREVDSLDGKMKEDVSTLKNEYVPQQFDAGDGCLSQSSLQMDIDNRKHDARAELKAFEIAVEVCHICWCEEIRLLTWLIIRILEIKLKSSSVT